MDHVRRVVIGLGSNVGDRLANLDAAMARLRADRALHVLRRSPVYETPPAGGPPQGDYLNAAVLLVTSLDAREILDRALAVERELGRERSTETRWGPRTIDLDLLWIEGEAITEEGLEVPHPRLADRAFAVRPLLDVAPDAVDFRTGTAYATLPTAGVTLSKFADASR
ncbi:2-amino-4-hydroxy-6-hydroxymethyldihydropteridine pyrophosphokinase [Minicystis rosea]|nr:2-amino-4-hydroxy-6-hydroxymethyldihydropteridine pyrophosphokinase [Minicystis rosea]